MHRSEPVVEVLVPVKSLAASKLRLAGFLTPAERAKFSLLMLGDVLANLSATATVDRVTVVSDDPDVLEFAARRHAQQFSDTQGNANDPLNEALTLAAAQLDDASAVMVVPADVPLVSPADYAAALSDWVEGVAVVPAHDGGTNAMINLVAEAIPFRFGPQSLEQHCVGARARGLPFQLIENPVWARDIDSPSDIAWLAEHAGRCASADFAGQLLRAKDTLKRTA